MRTTIDIPEDLLRQAKAQAALRGIRLKDFVTEALRAALHRGRWKNRGEKPVSKLHLGENCTFPLIRGECGTALRDLTPEKIHAILEEEEVERAIDSRGR